MRTNTFKNVKQHFCNFYQPLHKQDLTVEVLSVGCDMKAACFYAFIILFLCLLFQMSKWPLCIHFMWNSPMFSNILYFCRLIFSLRLAHTWGIQFIIRSCVLTVITIEWSGSCGGIVLYDLLAWERPVIPGSLSVLVCVGYK